MRLRFAALCVLAVTAGSLVAQAKKDAAAAPNNDRKAQLDAMIKDFVTARQEAAKAMRAAKTEAEQKAADEKMPKASDFLPRVHSLIAGDAADEIAAEALAFAVFGLD